MLTKLRDRTGWFHGVRLRQSVQVQNAGDGVASNGSPEWLAFIPARKMNWGSLRSRGMPGDHRDGLGSDDLSVQ